MTNRETRLQVYSFYIHCNHPHNLVVYGNSERRGELSVIKQTMTQDLLMFDTPVHRVHDYLFLKFGK